MEEKPDIRSLNSEQLSEYFLKIGEKTFRAKQLWQWLWQKNASSFEQITSLSKTLREKIEKDFTLNKISVNNMQLSSDGTIKNSIKLQDGLLVESVMIPTDKRTTACVSSQVGCSMGCLFCATAKLKKQRNLDLGEIIDQVVEIDKQSQLFHNRPLSNIVFMGMGEPLLNIDNVLKAIEIITSEKGLHFSWKRVTVSTSGLAGGIRKISDADNIKFNLAVSLHSAIDEKRKKIMPAQSDLKSLEEALLYWYQKTGRPVSYEYIVWQGFNDTLQDAKALLKFCEKIPCKVNLIHYNDVEGSDFKAADPQAIQMYKDILERATITVVERVSRGADIDAACGQLIAKQNIEQN